MICASVIENSVIEDTEAEFPGTDRRAVRICEAGQEALPYEMVMECDKCRLSF